MKKTTTSGKRLSVRKTTLKNLKRLTVRDGLKAGAAPTRI